MEVKAKFVEGDPSKERERLQLRIGVLEESVKSSELESKASRETALRLVEELDHERRRATSSAAALDSVKVQLDGLVVGRKSIELEKKTLMEGLEASKRVTEAARRESSFLEKQLEELERRFQSSQRETRAAEEKLQEFLKKVAELLRGASEGVVEPTERDVLYAVENICHKTLPEMEARMCRIAEQHNSSAQLAGQQVQELKERVKALETELLSADAHQEKLLNCQKQYEKFLNQLSETMKVGSSALDLGPDLMMKLLLARAEQIFQQETATLHESKCLSYSLQRKLKTQKDQLDSKGIHIQLLKKKVAELEEEKKSYSALAADRDGARTEARKLQKRLECLQRDLRVSKQRSNELKAQLSLSDELKSKVLEQSGTAQEQKRRLERLAEAKAAVEKKLDSADSELKRQEERIREEQQSAVTLRQSLQQLSERERELSDFRMIISQMLGLDVTAVAFPNYEIIKMLETRLLAAHHHHHQINTPWLCPTHHCLRGHHFPIDSWVVDASTSDSPGPVDVASPHRA